MYIRKVKKNGKIYSYYYKSRRIGNKVKSIYVGRALEEDIKKPVKQEVKNIKKEDNKNIVQNLVEFDNLLNEVNSLIQDKNLNNAIFVYNKMFEVYKEMNINVEDKSMVFEKLNETYDKLVSLGKENKISLD
jgi:heterodisulfide reductase subunit A-like polyferredoxin